MERVALCFDYYTDIVEVPNEFLFRLKKIQKDFDKWLYDKQNDHGLWIYKNGKKYGVSFNSDDFVNYLNGFHLKDSSKKCTIVERKVTNIPSKIPELYF